ncbi:MAG TPA: hypothetical protein VMY38_02815 [Gemmatimonadaceae bacterium]|nr:hypothetical protein [Gemmatimonadaceae bacterium]
MRPTTRYLLVALAFVLTLFVTPKVHALYLSSLPLTDLVESEGGERRIVRIAGGESIEVVVHRHGGCPGLGVAAQSRSANADSLVLLADALFRAFRDEGAREPKTHRCLTVTLEPGIGRQDPINRREQYEFSLWRRRTDQRWVLFAVGGDREVQATAQRMLGARWPRTTEVRSTPPVVSPMR